MPFFNIKDGNIKAIPNPQVASKKDVDWLIGHLILNDNIFAEKLLFIGTDTTYLLALDDKAELVVAYVSERVPDANKIGSICELAWSLRYLTYDDLERIASEHFLDAGVDISSLVDLHSQHFDLKQPVRSKRFNETQRVIILAPSFDQVAANAICWRRAETDIVAFTFSIVEGWNSERLLIIQTDVKGTAISSVMSAIGGVPATIKRRLLRKDRA